jgi:uncharacterized membrane protein YraQ (UPF0718 family)
MIYLSAASLLVLLVLGIKDRKKTFGGLKIAVKKLINILPIIFVVFFLLAVLFHFIPAENLAGYLMAGRAWAGFAAAVLGGSLFLLPGFIAFPLAGMLAENQVPYFIISAFTSSLMMVGIVTLPVEAAYFGKRLALLRNLTALLIALCVALVTGVFYAEF